ncbi:CRM-domain containing factor CFM2, chloroplastic isoform X2 [Rhododendron vialii]|uniref:CRM-domain containing factor CFM2, chloroplastic isoform X2 n=1 Tax=Rhododendron vialii TaxID=182163 RepID=UPI00265DFB34|nr:CRM-domain containing factor CFM2, chloroplastic isoform X2 [Rhododendron vialii]
MLLPLFNCNYQSSSSLLPISSFPKPLLRPKFLLLRPSASADTQTVPDSAIKRIADKLRSLGYVEDDDRNKPPTQTLDPTTNAAPGEVFIPLPNQLPKHRVGHTIDTSWSAPEKSKKKGEERGERVPTLAELTMPREEVRRLRRLGIELKKKLKVGKAGVTEGIVNGIHERWRNSEVVKLFVEDVWRLNMQRTHDLLERKTGGLVVWRSGGIIVLYRGANYKFPYFSSDPNSTNDTSAATSLSSSTDSGVDVREESFSSDADGTNSTITNLSTKMPQPHLIQGVGSPNRVRFQLPGEAQLAEEVNRLLDGLGPRFTNWWGYDPLPVDADLLPAILPRYRKPFRLLPYGVKPKLTNDELTILKRLGWPLPCHFVLGRNKNLQGLAASIVKLWEKSEIAKIAVKRGVENTNSELMAEELKWLTGGTLLSRDKEFIIFYRGKDFLPAAVSSAIEERRKCAIPKEEQGTGYSSSVMTQQECKDGMVDSSHEDEWDGIKGLERNLVSEQKKLGFTEADMNSTRNKLHVALEKKARAEKLLAELEKGEIPQEPEIDKEGITEEERFMLRKVGLRMKPFLLLGRRGVFDGTVENMHLHWKYRELVKVICGGRSIQEVQGIAQTLETESGGILVTVERISKGFAILVYRGKNYKQPASLRPRTLLSKREALKRSIEAQRHKSLKLHVLKLTRNVDELKLQLARERSGFDSSSFNSNDGTACPETNQQDMLRDSPLLCLDKVDEFNITEPEPEPVSELEREESRVLMGSNGLGVDAQSATCPDDPESQGSCYLPAVNAESHVGDEKAITPVESTKNGTNNSVHSPAKNIPCGVPVRAVWLSNRERLLLRKQALKMKKRPVLAVGKSNIVTGVAKTIKTHFQRHPLAIVNVKGRAKGTSVQELVSKLEEATGAVLVSHETNKVILYRGWGAEVEPGQTVERNDIKDAMKTSVGRKGEFRPVISPELLDAIRLECGLHRTPEEVK